MGRKVSLLLLILAGTVAWSATMVKSGLYGGFWGANGHDGVWHIALANSLASGSLDNPVFAGEQLKNYHIGFDLVLAFLHKITFVDISILYFQILPPLLVLGIGVSTFYFVYNWKKSFWASWWATFFIYFGGSWSWMLGRGESMFWSQQSISTLINPPFALSLLLLLVGLIFLQKKKWLLAAAVFGILIQVKVYAGILALAGLFLGGIFIYLRKKDFILLKSFGVGLLISILLFLPLNVGSGSLIVWQPFWFLETMMGLSDRVGWTKFYEAMLNYKSGEIYGKFVIAYGISFIIFWFGNLGTRVVKEVYVLNKLRNITKIEWQDVFLAIGILLGICFPMFFLQKGTPWNTIQFFYYALMFSGILAGISLSEILFKTKNLKLKIAFAAIVILLTVPTTLISLRDIYIPVRPPAKISSEEIEALNFLSEQHKGIVLTFPYDAAKAKEAENNPPRPLYLYESTAYVSAFSSKPVYLEDEVNLNIMDYDWKFRRNNVEQFYQSEDQNYVYNFLRENNIKYIYWVKPQRAVLGESQLGIEKIFENSTVDVYRVQ